MKRGVWVCLLGGVVLWGCAQEPAPAREAGAEADMGSAGDLAVEDAAAPEGDLEAPVERAVELRVDTRAPVAEVSPRFLSVAVDVAQVVGGTFWDPEGGQGTTGAARVPAYDFSRPRLRLLAGELAPAYLRIGGSDADLTWYDMGDEPAQEAPTGDAWVLTREQWDGVHSFAQALDYEVLFTLNAGPGSRGEEGEWRPENARGLLEYSAQRGYPVALWELGNEINAFRAIHGLGAGLTAQQYTADMGAARALVDELTPEAALGGPSSAFWPLIGESFPIYADFLAQGGELVDVITWHYYPQQSRRCPAAVLLAEPLLMLDPERLAEVDHWAQLVEGVRDEHSPGTPVWLGESGHAQCGGEPGVSETFVSGFWWLDQLGRLARRGQPVVVRQTLSGSNYGLLEDNSLEPRPDYWSSVLWRRLMGPRVLAAAPVEDAGLVAYAHCAQGRPGAVTALLLNLDPEAAASVDFEAGLGLAQERYLITSPELLGQQWWLNGELIQLGAQDAFPALAPVQGQGSLELPPASMAFVVFPQAGAAACQ